MSQETCHCKNYFDWTVQFCFNLTVKTPTTTVVYAKCLHVLSLSITLNQNMFEGKCHKPNIVRGLERQKEGQNDKKKVRTTKRRSER